MKLTVLVSTIISIAWLGLNARAQEMPDSAQKAEIMAEYQELAAPGEEHRVLYELAGVWNQAIKYWPESGAEPLVSTGTSVNKSILGGRFLQCNAVSGEGELTMQSLIILGYDRRHQCYTSVGFDTRGTYYMTAAGHYDDSTKTMTLYGEDDDPISGVIQQYDIIIKMPDKDTYSSEVISKNPPYTISGEPFKVMEIISHRAK
jgi:hypothetical protein